ncbi:MAG: ABC transporter permease [Gammaproteobacteria bacterium]|nr:ABC transporter permease [Gammaproteobacteria bacterium]
MRFLPLIWSGLWRKPGRTILIFLQVTVAFTLYGVLQGLKTGVENAAAAARADLLIVHGRQGFNPLPLALLDTIRSVPGVKRAVPVEMFGATYQKPAQRLQVVAVDPAPGWDAAFTFTSTPESLAAFARTRTAALMSADIAHKYGWHVGEHVPLKSTTVQTNGSTDWAFDIVGTYTDTDVGGARDQILVSFPYVEEARVTGKGSVNHYNLAVTAPTLAVSVADEIDRRFANSAHETETESLREMAQSNMQSIGDLNFLIRAIVSAVLVALLFSTVTSMVQGVRERTAEIAVLKTVGFTARAVFLLILSEALLVFVLAAACGVALATVVFPFADAFVHGIAMPASVVALGLVFGGLVGLLTAALPALLSARLRVAAALAGR